MLKGTYTGSTYIKQATLQGPCRVLAHYNYDYS